MIRSYELRRDETRRTIAWHVDDNQYYAHFHSTLELIYVESGVLQVMQNGAVHLVPEGGLVVNSSYVVHGYSTPEHSRIIVATIPLAEVPSLRAQLEQNRFSRGIVDAPEIKDAKRLMYIMADPSHRDNARFVGSIGEALLALLIEKIGLTPNVSDAEDDLIKRMLRYIGEHAAEPLNVAGVAAHFGYSAGRFSHIFNEKVGCSLTRYVNSLRCRMAEGLLRQSAAPLTEVAALCGFSSLRTFHRVYREYAGSTPRGGAPSGAEART